MAKDPAFLFYPGDWMGGTIGMSFEEKGAYLELLLFQFNRGAFTEKQALSVIRSNDLWQILKEKFSLQDGLYINLKLKAEKEKRQKYTESRSLSRKKSDEDNVRIYIVRDNVRMTYKIGSSVNPLRRYNELSNQKNPAIMADEQGNRNITLVWYSAPVRREEEKKLHKTYEHRHISGEWFTLAQSDLDSIYSTYQGTYVERTNIRTENENENEYINKVLRLIEETEKKEINKKDYMFLIVEMAKIFIDKNPDYFFEKETDYHACLQIAYNIAQMKKWMKADLTNGKMKDALDSWQKIVEFVKKDDWLATRSLSDLSSTKEWQRLVQKMKNDKVIVKKNIEDDEVKKMLKNHGL